MEESRLNHWHGPRSSAQMITMQNPPRPHDFFAVFLLSSPNTNRNARRRLWGIKSQDMAGDYLAKSLREHAKRWMQMVSMPMSNQQIYSYLASSSQKTQGDNSSQIRNGTVPPSRDIARAESSGNVLGVRGCVLPWPRACSYM